MKKAMFFIFTVLLVACDNGGGHTGTQPSSSSGGDIPGGQEIGSYAALPSNQNAGRIGEMYDQWINTYYVTFEGDGANPDFAPEAARGTARIKANYDGYNDGSRTCSEAIGYGMLATSLMEDWERFDKLLKYSKAFRIANTALMKWSVSGFTTASGGSATDADIDILASLLIAYKKTDNQSYLNDALDVGASIYDLEIEPNSKLLLPAMKSDPLMTKKGFFYNISYISLAAIKTLAKYDSNRDWNAVLEANLNYIKSVQDAGDGLWPDWSDASGTPTNPDNNSNQSLTASDGSKVNSYEAYSKESVRIPWRIAWYYHWYGDSRAKDMLDNGINFLRSKGANTSDDLKDFYSYTGGKQSASAAGIRTWVSLCALGMGNSDNQGWLNDCNGRILNFYNPALSSYYASSLQLIYAMLFNGKF